MEMRTIYFLSLLLSIFSGHYIGVFAIVKKYALDFGRGRACPPLQYSILFAKYAKAKSNACVPRFIFGGLTSQQIDPVARMFPA